MHGRTQQTPRSLSPLLQCSILLLSYHNLLTLVRVALTKELVIGGLSGIGQIQTYVPVDP